ncbi:MAG: pirin family protein [Marinicaulis sp.]|nr:pirin family protein [Marinicaulis sp.]
MITIRKSVDRGHANHGWLDARHTFSFANYYHPDHMGYRSLRVMNEDRINPGAGFPTHGHRDMEIITYVLEGALQHKDSTGGGGVIAPGMVQYMAAGTGVEHSEFNASQTDPVHLYQIWIEPDGTGHAPAYAEREIGDANEGVLALIASRDGREDSFKINQDADLYAARLKAGDGLSHRFAAGRAGWLQVAKGGVELPEGSIMQAGDGAKIEDVEALSLKALDDSEVLLFDLA